MKPFFSIVIIAKNEEKEIPHLLISICEQTFRDFEVIVNNSNSQDKTEEKTLFYKNLLPKLVHIKTKSKNVSAARNSGFKPAEGKWIIFLDADVTMEPAFLEKLIKDINQGKEDVLTVWNRPKNKFQIASIPLHLLNIGMTMLQKIAPVGNGPCLIFRKDVFEKIGGFDENVIFGEDLEIIQRVHKKGLKFAVLTGPRLYVSTRRMEKEGLFLSLYKTTRSLLHYVFSGPIRKKVFEYEMGGQYYKK